MSFRRAGNWLSWQPAGRLTEALWGGMWWSCSIQCLYYLVSESFGLAITLLFRFCITGVLEVWGDVVELYILVLGKLPWNSVKYSQDQCYWIILLQWLNDFLFTIYWGRNAPELYVDGLVGWDWDGLDLCVGWLYEHRFAVLITSLWRLQEYNDYNDVTMAYEDGTQVRHTRSSLHQLVQLCNFPTFVRPYNNCKVRSYNNCKVRPYNECKVWPYNSFKVSHFYVLHSCKVAPYNQLMICIIAAVLCYIFMWVYFFKVKPNILKKYFL